MNATATMRLLALGAVAVLGGCIASNVIATEQRMAAVAQPVFEPAGALQLEGLYASVDVQGEVAAQLRKVYYVFLPDGSYTGAALVDSDGLLAFQTLTGRFAVTGSGLALDGAEPVPLAVAGDLLRIEAPGGALVLRREVLR
jgi:hypothetical protein